MLDGHLTPGPSPQLLATHRRSRHRGAWVVDRSHWDGLPHAPEAASLPPCEAVGPNELDPVWAPSQGRHAGGPA